MIVFRIAQAEYAKDLSGRGSFLYGGRWNSAGNYALYTSTHRSLALLELLVHVPLELIRQKDYYLLSIEVPTLETFPIINELENAREKGDSILNERSSLYFSAPSVIFPAERNIIINPLHRNALDVSLIDSTILDLDYRFQ